MKKQILIVDDEADFSHLLKLSLESEGYYNVREENDPNKVLEAAREFAPDLIVLDVMMPWRHGNDVAAQLHADPLFTDIPVVFLTALAAWGYVPSEANKHACQGSHAYLPKGAPVTTLIDSIEQLLARRREKLTDRQGDRQLLMFKLSNLRRNRDVCLEAHRRGFDLLIENAERALAELGAGDMR